MGIPAEVRAQEAAIQLKRMTGVTPAIHYAPVEWGFRDKVKLAVTGTIENPILGLLAPDLRSGIEIPDCPIQAPTLNQQIPLLKNFITRWRLTPYQVLERRGELKGIILSWSPTSRQMMLRFVLRSRESLDRIRQGLPELSAFHVVSVNIQPIPHAVLEGEEEIILTQAQAITHHTSGPTLFFAPKSFMQTNGAMASRLYAEAQTWLAPLAPARALDLFCGVGGFALHLAQVQLTVHGVEVSEEAIYMAEQAAQENQLSATFQAAKAESISEKWQSFAPEIVVVNPPRKGLGATLPLVLNHLPQYLLYSSCDLTSLEADLTLLSKHYLTLRSSLFDMFPFTHHFEALTLLVRR